MNEINVGEYVRTKEGRFFQIANIDYDDYITSTPYKQDKDYEGRYDFDTKTYFLYLNKEQMQESKHSPNIIDLIEVRRLCEWTFSY